MDGHTGLEHTTALAPLYGDVTTFLGQAKNFNSYTPLVAGYGAFNEEYFWQEADQLWKDPRLQRWLPWRQIVPQTRRYIKRPETDYSLGSWRKPSPTSLLPVATVRSDRTDRCTGWVRTGTSGSPRGR